MTVINMAAVVNEDVFFLDDDKETNLVELWAQNQCLYEATSEEPKYPVKEVVISVYLNFGQKAPREPKFQSPLYPGSCPNMSLPSCLTSSPSSQNKQNNK